MAIGEPGTEPGLLRAIVSNPGSVPDSSHNIVERAIRPQTVTRKNILFAGSDGGGRTWATIATLLQTCRMNNVDPTAWLTQTLERIANQWPSSEIDTLMPWNYRH
jgi:transposase